MDISSLQYKRAFNLYLRKGVPIDLTLKQARTTTHYIWRTRKDGKVRSSHAANDGKIFEWSIPPSTGHPGEDYGCRCVAEAYVPNLDEHITITLGGVSDSGSPWSSADFINHYFNGNGRGVTVREIGHLQPIVNRYKQIVIDDPKRLPTQIADVARQKENGSFSDTFEEYYQMEGVVFSIGNTVIEGRFSGHAKSKLGIITLKGEINFALNDSFEDPGDLLDLLPGNIEIIDLGETILENIHRPLDNYLRGKPTGPIDYGIHTGDPYKITDKWTGVFEGKIYSDNALSIFG